MDDDEFESGPTGINNDGDDIPEEDDGSQDEDDDDEDDNNTTVQDGDQAGDDGDADADAQSSSLIVHSTPTLASLSDPERIHTVREIGYEAFWNLSSSKPGNGVTQLRDESSDTYWQSDGPQPHLINIHFSRRKAVCEVAFYLDFNLDESYTPKRIGIKAGITHHDLEEVKVVELHEPVGWVSVPLFAELDPLDDDVDDIDGGPNSEGNGEDENEASANAAKRRKPLRTFLLQICVLSMHQNGRDVHVRQVKIFGPRTTAGEASEIRASSGGTVTSHSLGMPRFQTVEMTQFAIR